MSKILGVIGEDASDIEVLKILARKLTTRSFSVAPFYGKGCGSIKRKLPGWCTALAKKGCKAVVVVHDQDRHTPNKLRKDLEEILSGVSEINTKIVVIPIEEIEAWLLSDSSAIKKAMNLIKNPRTIYHPEQINSPKEHLGRIIRSHSKGQVKTYVNTTDNSSIALATNISLIQKRCPSFSHFENFVLQATK